MISHILTENTETENETSETIIYTTQKKTKGKKEKKQAKQERRGTSRSMPRILYPWTQKNMSPEAVRGGIEGGKSDRVEFGCMSRRGRSRFEMVGEERWDNVYGVALEGSSVQVSSEERDVRRRKRNHS
jgi:hypothetical protein